MKFVRARIFRLTILRKSYLRKVENTLKSYVTEIVYLFSYNTKVNRYYQDTDRRYSYNIVSIRYIASL